MVLFVAFQTNQVGFIHAESEGPAARHGLFGMGKTAAVGGQAVCQPVIRLVQGKCQTLRMSDVNA